MTQIMSYFLPLLLRETILWRARFLSVLFLGCLSAGPALAAEPFAFAELPAGRFLMGAEAADPAADPSEFPQREIQVETFALAKVPVTRGAYAVFIRESGYAPAPGCWTLTEEGWRMDTAANWRTPGFAQEDSHPAVCVSAEDAEAYAAWLGRETGTRYRLPSEAEWEYAARGGAEGLNSWGDDPARACLYANVNDLTAKNKTAKVAERCSDGYLYTSPAGAFRPNGFGLYDMQGNVWEWTSDCWRENLADAEADCRLRTRRGGSWTDIPGPVRLAARQGDPPDFRNSYTGFRLVRASP